MDDAPETPDKTTMVLKALGRGLWQGTRAVGLGVAAAWKAIDPDVRRHLLQVPLLLYSPLGSRARPVVAGVPDGHPPLVLVHGLGGTRGDLLPLALYLALHGRKRSYRVGFSFKHDLPEQAAALAAFVRQVLEVTGEPRVDMVTHSLGGLVARLALADPELAGRVGTLVTLGAPHGGTYTARYADTQNTRVLRPDSEFIQALARAGLPAGVRVVACWSRADVFVLPPESAVPAGAEAVELSPATHYGYLLSPRSWEAVRNALASG
jgi:pimeloyl-ACP methyl ester carboxylesterase